MKILKGKVMIKVFFKGSVLLLKDTEGNRQLLQEMHDECKEKHLRFEFRKGRMRQVFYYDYDKPKDHE